MRIRKSESGSAASAALLALLQVIMVVVTVYIFAAKLYSPPAPITDIGRAVDEQYSLTLWVTAVVFVLSQLGLAYAVWRFRDHGQRAHFSRGNNTMEFVWTTATIILFLGLGILGSSISAIPAPTENSVGSIPSRLARPRAIRWASIRMIRQGKTISSCLRSPFR